MMDFSSLLAISLTVATLWSQCSATLHQRLDAALQAKNYDYIIVGAGASGAVLASRLSEDPDVRVLLLEAGSSDVNISAIMSPGLEAELLGSRFDWNLTTTPQVGWNNRASAYPRGHVLGGSTSINAMAWTRGSRDDYDRWANVTGDVGWSWYNLYPYFINKLDRITPSADNHDPTGQFDPAVHGHTGNLNTSLSGFTFGTTARAISVVNESSSFPFNIDYNSGVPLGLSYIQSTISGGTRFSSYRGYLAPALTRSNLDIVVNTLVTKVRQTDTHNGAPVFRGVEAIADITSNSAIKLNASREVILSAGVVESPHILLASGIGDANHLQSVGVTPSVDLPDVGQNLHDHVIFPLVWNVRPNATTYDQLRENATFAADALSQWQASRTGPLTVLGTIIGAIFGWFRLPPDSPAFQAGPDPSAGSTSAHYELMILDDFSSFALTPPSNGSFLTVQAFIISPASRGNVSLASMDPRDAPLFNPNFFDDPLDLAMGREIVKAARAYVALPAWADYVISEFEGAQGNATSDDEIDAFMRAQGSVGLHGAGSVAMGRRGCSDRGCGALNPDLTVKGTVGLRVVDASSFPFVITGHTQAAAYVLAERAADLIKSAMSIA